MFKPEEINNHGQRNFELRFERVGLNRTEITPHFYCSSTVAKSRPGKPKIDLVLSETQIRRRKESP